MNSEVKDESHLDFLRVESMPIEIDGIRSLLIVALKQATVVATLELFHQDQPAGIAVVHNFFVRSECRKKGIGRRLMELAADLARREGCREMALGVNKSNDGAIEFYRSAGFTICAKEL